MCFAYNILLQLVFWYCMNIPITQVKLEVWTPPLCAQRASIEIFRETSLPPASVSPAPREALCVFPKGRRVSERTAPGLTERAFSQRSILHSGSCMWNIVCFAAPAPGSSAAGEGSRSSDIRSPLACLKSRTEGSAMGGWNLPCFGCCFLLRTLGFVISLIKNDFLSSQRNLTEYFVAVDVNNMLHLYASMLYERRILICCSKLSTVSKIHENFFYSQYFLQDVGHI